MNKKNRLILAGISLLIVVIILMAALKIGIFDYYRSAHEINQNLKADGLQLMMPLDDVRKIYGQEEIFNQGFGGNFIEYPSKGIVFSVSTDSDYDLYNKVGDLRISNPEYLVFGMTVGTNVEKFAEVLISKGYKENINNYGKKSYIKGCVYIDFSSHQDLILGFRIIVTDKHYDPDRIY